MLVSPVTFLAFERMCEREAVTRDEICAVWGLSPHGVRLVVREVVDMDLWTATGNALQPTGGRSNAFYGTGLIRASASRTLPWVAP